MVPSASHKQLWARASAAVLFAGASFVTLNQARTMTGAMQMPGGWEMSMMWMVMPGQTVWGAAWVFVFMWLAMMIAMMLPSVWPMLELYRKAAVASGERLPGLATTLTGAGYFTVWTVFGAVVFAIGFGLSSAAMRSTVFSRTMPMLAGAGLIFAGAYQLSPWKQACLRYCRSPLMFLGHVFHPGLAGALRVGVSHGAYCIACCWALMLIQMILGVMDLGVMILVAAVIGVEKLWSQGGWLARAVGAAAIVLGLVFLGRSMRT